MGAARKAHALVLAGRLAVAIPVITAVGLLAWGFLKPGGEPERRQFMWDCTTARGLDDAHVRQCASDWLVSQRLSRQGWPTAEGGR